MHSFIDNKLTLIPNNILDSLENNDFNNESFLLSVRQELFDIRRRAMFSYLDTNSKPQWDNVINFCISTLQKIKDLHVAIWLWEGLTRKYGFIGYIEGSIFLQQFCNNFMQNMWPKEPAAIEYCVFWINNCLTNSFMEIKVLSGITIGQCRNDQSNLGTLVRKKEDIEYLSESIKLIKTAQERTNTLGQVCVELFKNNNWEISPVKRFLENILDIFEHLFKVGQQNLLSIETENIHELEEKEQDIPKQDTNIFNKDNSIDVNNILEILRNLPEKDKQTIFSKIHPA